MWRIFLLGFVGSKKHILLFRAVVAGTQPAGHVFHQFLWRKKVLFKVDGLSECPWHHNILGTLLCLYTCVCWEEGKGAGQLYVLCNVVSKGVGYATDQAWKKSLMCFLHLKRGVYFDFEPFGVGKNCLCWWSVLPKIFHVTSFTPKNEVTIGSCLVAECLINLQFPWLHPPRGSFCMFSDQPLNWGIRF